MSKVHDSITPKLAAFMSAQPVFFVATAPLSGEGHVNVSPRGTRGTFAVLDEHRVAWLDLTGSGVETIAHLRENGRITVMFCAFEGAANIVRLHGTGEVVTPGDPRWDELSAPFPPATGARAVIVVTAHRISDSCGFSVPRMDYVEDRELLNTWAARKSPAQLDAYRRDRNATSIDGLPGYPG
ncbi:Pyridoxamine 5'-phosphate oxidase-related FMN-binding protein [metagenome]|uniref:Pyridoxamine 5'-phosphate oxidase-related FMN-binding protein n=1 Tax=metagenome TaxID=256318 RepID=A0A2P2C534_9ZZZZ